MITTKIGSPTHSGAVTLQEHALGVLTDCTLLTIDRLAPEYTTG